MNYPEGIDRIGPKLKFIVNSFRRITNNATAQLGITGTQSVILGYLSRVPDMHPCQHDIEVKFNIKHPTATGILKRMADKGLVEFTSDPYDKRLKRIVITKKGLDATDFTKQKFYETEAAITSNFTAEEMAQLHKLLDKLVINIRSQSGAQENYADGGDMVE